MPPFSTLNELLQKGLIRHDPSPNEECPICHLPCADTAHLYPMEGGFAAKFLRDDPKNPLQEYHVLKVSSCGHVFHNTCLLDWFSPSINAPLNQRSCPYCRMKLYNSSQREPLRRALAEVQVHRREVRGYWTMYQALNDAIGHVPAILAEHGNLRTRGDKRRFLSHLEEVLPKNTMGQVFIRLCEQRLLAGVPVHDVVPPFVQKFKRDISRWHRCCIRNIAIITNGILENSIRRGFISDDAIRFYIPQFMPGDRPVGNVGEENFIPLVFEVLGLIEESMTGSLEQLQSGDPLERDI